MQMNCGHLCNGMCIGELLAATHAQSLAAVYAWAFLAAVICTAVLVATHLFLGTIFRHPYSHLSSQQQLVTCFHTAYAITYTVLVAPFTYYTCRLLFGELSSSFSIFTTTFIFFNINSMMYVAEAGARAVVQRNWLLIIHHTVSHIITLIGFFKVDMFTMKLGLVLSLFAMYECALFATLAARKLGAPPSFITIFWTLGIALYTVTRALQFVALLFLFVGSSEQMRGCGKWAIFWIDLALSIIIAVLQLYTFPIYFGVLRRTQKNARIGRCQAGINAGQNEYKSNSATVPKEEQRRCAV